eukprot:Gb_13841 [translate_table: standard]
MLHSDTTIVVGKADQQSRLYTFSQFAPDTSLKSLDLLGFDHDSDSSDETLENILDDEDSSSSTNNENNDRDPSPSTPGHSSEDKDSPPALLLLVPFRLDIHWRVKVLGLGILQMSDE